MKSTYLASSLMLALASGTLMAQTIVTVNGQAIDSSDIDTRVQAIRATNANVADTPQLRNMLTERLIVDTVVIQEAKRLKLDQDADFKKALEESRKQAKQQGADKKPTFATEWAAYENSLYGQAYAMYLLKQNPVQEKDVQNSYNQYSQFYKGSQEVQLGEIMTRSKTDAQKAADELKAKKSFASVVKKYSADDAAKQAGGIIPSYIALKDLQLSTPPLYEAVKDLKKGGFTTPLQNGSVYGVFYVNDRRDVVFPPFEQVKDEIRQNLQAEYIDRSIGALLDKADIKPAK